MNPKLFQDLCVRNDMPGLDYTPISDRLSTDHHLLRLIHAAIGMSGEAGEIMDNIKKSMMFGKPIDSNNLREECGDMLWYMSIMLHELGVSFEDIMQQNVDKLKKRFPNGFTEKDALERKDKLGEEA